MVEYLILCIPVHTYQRYRYKTAEMDGLKVEKCNITVTRQRKEGPVVAQTHLENPSLQIKD